MPDEQWVNLLTRHARGENIGGITLPSFPSDDVQSQTVGSAREPAIREAGHFYLYTKQSMTAAGIQADRNTRLLDFGCGWGRMLRFYQKDLDPKNLYGADINAYLLDEAKRTGVPGQLAHIDPLGNLPYPDGTFDVVYAYSVFTHLPEPMQDHWLAEIARITKPGGLFIATVEPPRFLDFFLDRDPNDTKQHPWHLKMTQVIHSKPELKEILAERGFAYVQGTELYGDCVITRDYAFRHWSQYFDVKDYLDDKSRFWQAVVTCIGR